MKDAPNVVQPDQDLVTLREHFQLGHNGNTFKTTHQQYFTENELSTDKTDLQSKLKRSHLVYGFNKVDYSRKDLDTFKPKVSNFPAG